MPLINVRRVGLACAAALVVCGLAADAAVAQTPGAPQVTVFDNNAILITYFAPVTPPTTTVLVGTYNGVPIGPFPIGTATTVHSGVSMPPGAYTVQVFWAPGVSSPATAFVVPDRSLPATVLYPATIVGNFVTLNWDQVPGATGYDLEVFVASTSQTLLVQLGAETSVSFQNVPAGNYIARVRARNAVGPGPFSNQVLVSIGLQFRVRDLEVSLTWNTLADMDLHIIEPDGTHVFWGRRVGVTAVLDRDNTTGFGPETGYIEQGVAAPGVYQVYVVHYRGNAPTTSTIAITLGVGTPQAHTEIFTRHTAEPSAHVGYSVAFVDVQSGLIGEAVGIRPADERAGEGAGAAPVKDK